MLSAHYATNNSPATHPPLHPSQAQYGPVSSLLPTPPSSPPTIGMHPVEGTISLLESLVAFYHQERMWVYRTRAQLEMGLLHPGLDSQSNTPISEFHDDPDFPSQLSPDSVKTAEKSSASPPTKWFRRKKAFNLTLPGISAARSMLPTVARGGITKHPYPHLQHRARQSSNLNPASVSSSHGSAAMASSNVNVPFEPPTAMSTTTTLTSPFLSHPPFHPSTTPGPRYVSTPAHYARFAVQPSQLPTHADPLVLDAGVREPAVQILEMFERMMEARMESCERMTRMVREANKLGEIGLGTTSAVGGGVSLGTIDGPVGGFGGSAGVPVGVESQDYSRIQATPSQRDG